MNYKKYSVAIVSFFIGVGATLIGYRFQANTSNSKELHLGQKQFINPLIDCQTEINKPANIVQLESKLKNYILDLEQSKKVEQISVYYRDLNNGPTFGIGEDFLFTTASLLKVPLMIGIYKLAQENENILSTKIKYDPKSHDIQSVTPNINPAHNLVPNNEYAVKDLVYRMIVYSDNASAGVLFKEFPFDMVQLLKEIGVILEVSNGESKISVKNYASIFRVLFNATFLEKKYSNLALENLSFVTFMAGLNQGLPSDINISHKFGERKSGEVYQFHDCGIIYYPNRPYLLCIMTRGVGGFPDLVSYISNISQMVYREQSK